MEKKFATWDEFEKELDITSEQEEQIRLEMEIIDATIKAREKQKLTQRELSKRSGIKQSAIARLEKSKNSPRVDTLMRLLYSMGYTLKVVPLNKINKNN
ncbi:MAG: helix-turn-helix domain-containing protein [Clostridia bacterium]|nr:helix-turn-helix domain-containing protein [Clostridia bacterium]